MQSSLQLSIDGKVAKLERFLVEGFIICLRKGLECRPYVRNPKVSLRPFLLARSVALCSSYNFEIWKRGLRRNRHRVQQNCWGEQNLLPSGFQNLLLLQVAFRLWIGKNSHCLLSISFACLWPRWIRTGHSIILWISFGHCADLYCGYRQRP